MGQVRSVNIKKFQTLVLAWFDQNKRELPWRKHRNWYTVWISEIMLQQTQVRQVIPYYLRFMKVFPDLKKLASARQENVLKIWEGLGFYSRARNLHKTAKIISTQFDGILPQNVRLLSRLPGFGPYTTRAVLSIAYNQPLAVVDGNIMRVISRLYAIRLPKTRTKIQNIMDRLIDKQKPGLFNEAMMELGATICLPANPHCTRCPLQGYCTAHQTNKVEKYPGKSKSTSKPILTSLVLLIEHDYKFLLVKRPQQGLLAGMWEFPTFSNLKFSEVQNLKWRRLLKKWGIHAELVKKIPAIHHEYSHFKIRLIPFHVRTGQTAVKLQNYEKYRWTSWNDLNKMPLHRSMYKLMEKHDPS